MKLLFPLLALLSLGNQLLVLGSHPFDDLESSTLPQLTGSGTNFPGAQQLFPGHRNLLQNSRGLVEVCHSRSGNKTLHWRRSGMGFLFDIDYPESCGNLSKSELSDCEEDINVKDGCCSKKCIDVFRKISPKCWKDLAAETCSEKLISDVKRMDGLRRRCFPELGPFSCKDCDPKSRKRPSEKQQDLLANLAHVKAPEECGKFKSLDLLACENDFNVGPGCCDAACHDVLQSMSDECWVFFNLYTCLNKRTEKSVRIMDELSEKCEPVHRPVSCEKSHFKTSLTRVSVKIKRNDGARSTTSKAALVAWAIAPIAIAYAL